MTKDKDLPLHVSQREVFFARRLANNEKKNRDRALKLLSNWLSTRDTFTELDMMKVWKGLFYCFWHSDKVPIQMELAERLSGLIFVFKDSPEMSSLFIQTFFITMHREWLGIDRLRLDKYYSFIRFFLRHIFMFMSSKKWVIEDIEPILNIFTLHAVGQEVRRNAPGILLHLADIYLTELMLVMKRTLPEKEASQSPEPPASPSQKGKGKKGKGKGKGKKEEEKEEEKQEDKEEDPEESRRQQWNKISELFSPEIMVLLLSPFINVLSTCEDRICVRRVVENVFDALLKPPASSTLTPTGSAACFIDEVGPKTWKILIEALSKEVFATGTQNVTLSKNRRILYSVSERFRAQSQKMVLEEGDSEKSKELENGTPRTPDRENGDGLPAETPPSSRKRKRSATRVPTPHPDPKGGNTEEPSALINTDRTQRQKRLNQELLEASNDPADSPSSSSSGTTLSAESVVAEKPKKRKRVKSSMNVSESGFSTPKPQTRSNSLSSFSTPGQKKRVHFNLGKNKVQEAKEAISHHPPVPAPHSVPASPAMRREPKAYPPPPRSPGLSGMRNK